MERKIVRRILKHFGIEANTDHEAFVTSAAATLRKRCGNPIYLNSGESLALSVVTPKIAALAFDKVYRIPVLSDPVPEEIGFYCATQTEMIFWAISLFVHVAEQTGIGIAESEDDESQQSHGGEAENLALLCSEFRNRFAIEPTLFYHSPGSCAKDFPSGKQRVLTAAISNVAMVNEKDLTWEQVLEFRKDKETRIKYRRFVRWIDTELKGKSPDEVVDIVALRLDDYQWALKKHGLKASVGALSCLLDPKFLGATSATVAASAVAGGAPWAALAGASLAIGQAALSFGTSLLNGIDERRKENYEVAYIHEIHKRLG